MRISTLVPFAIAAATVSTANAQPIDQYMFSARGDADVLLSERDIQMLDIFSREYLAARGCADLYLTAREDDSVYAREYGAPELVARGPFDQPQRESFKNAEDYEKAWLAWSKRTREMSKKLEKVKYVGPPPQRENYASYEEAQAAHTQWFQESRKASQQSQKIVQSTQAKAEQAAVKQAQHERKLDEQDRKKEQSGPSSSKKPGLVGKLLGKGKGKREALHDDEQILE